MGKLRKFARTAALVLVVVLVIGGAYLGYLLTSNSYPVPDADGWIRLQDMPRPRGETGATFAIPGPPGTPDICPQGPCQPQFFVIGGLAGPFGKTVADVDILDSGSGDWRQGTPLPEARHHPAAASVGGAVYVTGGAKNARNWTPEAEMWVLRPGSDSWDPLPDMPEGRMGHAMLAIEGKLYVIGGRGETANVLVYDLQEGWSEKAPMPGKRDHLAAVQVGATPNPRIYAIGGRDDRIRARVDIYDVTTDSWTTGPPMPAATSGMAAELLADGRIHVVGGEDPGTLGGEVFDTHFVLDPATGTWGSGPKASLAVHGAASDQVAGILLIVGGARRHGAWSTLAWTGVSQRFDAFSAGAPSPSPTPTATGTSPTPTPTPTPT
ncbi:MAG TPA: kelch repeat-containing protein [Actinomycetota bacterium]|nr:kelch repeat-containing protein [Actinomycetota bacterium]